MAASRLPVRLITPVAVALLCVSISWTGLAESPDARPPRGSGAVFGPGTRGILPLQSKPGSTTCVVQGSVTSQGARLPGVVLTLTDPGDQVVAAGSTDVAGGYLLAVPGPGSYRLTADMAFFDPLSRDVTVDATCKAVVDVELILQSRVPKPAGAQEPAAPADATATNPAQPPAGTVPPQGRGTGAGVRPGMAGRGAAQPGTPAPPGSATQQPGQTTTPTTEQEQADAAIAMAQLSLPPGFTLANSADAIVTTGSAGMVDPFLQFGPPGEFGGMGGRGGMDPGGMFGEPGGEGQPQGAAGGMGGPGSGPMGGGGRGGGRGGGGGLAEGLAGRLAMAGRGMQQRIRVQANYNLSGSMLDAEPYSLTGQAQDRPPYSQHRFGATVGGPVRVPGVFDLGSQTTFNLSYNGNYGSTLFDRYSTVPTEAIRNGDLSLYSGSLTDPATGLPFPGNRIPADRIDPVALSLLKYYPLPNLTGDLRNFHYVTSSNTTSNDINFRFIRSFGTVQRGRGGVPAMRAGGGRGGGRGGSNLMIGLSYRGSTSDQLSSFPSAAGTREQSAWNVPVNFTFQWKGIFNTLRVQYSRNRSTSTNLYANQVNVAGDAGIEGVSTDPFSWGIPTLSFSTFTALRDITPSERTDQTVNVDVTQMKQRGRHTLRWGGGIRTAANDTRSDSNPWGSFIFTGLYTSGGSQVRSSRSGLDFADFLLGYTQQASLQYGPGLQRYRNRSWNAFFMDDWRVRANFTLNAGVRYEYQSPFWEADNRLVNLDVAPDFSAVVPVLAGASGPYGGAFPTSGIRPDRNNIAPRVGFAWRAQTRTVVRGGYGINYSSPTYASIVRNLASQPPFAVTDTRLGTLTEPLLLTTALAGQSTAETTNNYGVDLNYRLGVLQLWNLDIQRDLTRTMNLGVGYTGTRGSSLDVQRAPNRDANGPILPDVSPFLWQQSTGRSIMHAFTLRFRKRPTRGFGGGVTYTFSKSMDDASSIGGGGAVVAQDDQNLAAEWGRSSFDQRHRLSGDFTLELPFGPNRPWLNGEGFWGYVFGGWGWTTNVTLASGNPLTARLLSNAADVARGTNGTLRADWNGQPIALDNPTQLMFFNTAAFSVPAAGTYGNAARNTIPGPGSFNVNMSLAKNFRLPANRSINLRVQANNVFNMAQWGGVDTVVNSPTFGQITSMRSMRSVQILARVSF